MKIPSMDFRGNKFINPDATLTDVAQNFFDSLEQLLLGGVGDQSFVVPTQDANGISVIEQNQTTSPTGLKTYTCRFGTLVYDETNNKVLVTLNNGSDVPIFKQILTT